MLRLLGAFLVLSVLLIGTAWGGGYGDAVRPASLTDTDNSPKVTVDKPGIPLQQGEVLDSPGIQVGTSYYDYQANGSTGNRVAVHDCGIHFAWMNGVGAWTGNRWIYYNYMDPDGNLGWPGGTQVSVVQGAGYTTIDNDAAGKALIAFHSGANMIVTLAEDDACGSGNFTLYDVPNAYTGYLDFYWPYLTYDYGGRVHVVSTENATGGQVIGHTFTDDYNNWPALQLGNNGIDINTVSVMTTSSLVDNKVAIVYMRGSAQTVNDVAYHESMDGITWNYADVNNITNYQQADSVRGYSDLDAVYDYNGNLHIIWGAQAYLVGPTNGALLMHWSEATGTDMIASGWWTSNCGVWNSTISKMSIGKQ